MQVVAEAQATVAPRLPGREYDRIFFGSMPVLLLLIALIGFGRSYFLAGVFRAPLPAPILHVHGALNTAWLLLLVVQALLVSAKKIKWHMTLGIAGFCLAVLMAGVGFAVSANQLHRYAGNPRILSFETIPFFEEVCFAVLVAFAFALRRKAAAHKRLILLATIAMLPAAFTRFPIHAARSEFFTIGGVCGLLALMLLYDGWSLHRLHRATVAGTVLLVSYLAFAPLVGHTAIWLRFALWMQSLNI